MKKTLIIAVICCLTTLFSGTVFAQDVQNQLSRYVTSQLNNSDQNDIAKSSDNEEDTTDQSYEELKAALQRIIENKSYENPEIAKDVTCYITESAKFSASGKMDSWEQKRSELFKYVQDSNWRTGKNISEADRAFWNTIQEILYGLIKDTARVAGCDRIFDLLEEEEINKYENKESIQVAIATVETNISDALHNDDHAINKLYIDIQRNAFNVLGLNRVDFNKISAQYPEVKYLFEDMYTFFKWRNDLRNNSAAYALNENNIDVEFHLAATTNSFFAFWELANIAKSEMRNATENNENDLSTLSVTAERDSMKLFDSYARQALYFGRIWNGMQRYAVKRGLLPETLDPKRGARKNVIKKAIKDSFDKLTDAEVLSVLDDVRAYYAEARAISEKYWKEWASKQDEKKLQENLKQMLQKIEQITDSLNIKVEQDTLNANTLQLDTFDADTLNVNNQ